MHSVGIGISESERMEAELRKSYAELERRGLERTEELMEVNEVLQVEVANRKEAEEALRKAELRYRAIFEQAGVGVAQIDSRTGRFVQVNQKCCEILGLTEAEVLATDFMNSTHPDDLAVDLQNMERLRRGEVGSFTMEKRLLRHDGSPMWITLNVAPLWRPGEEPLHHIAVVEDISARKKLEEQQSRQNENLERLVVRRAARIRELEAQRGQAEKLAALGQLAASVAHEINNPIAGIKNAFLLVKEAVDVAHPHFEFVGMIDREIDRIALIVQSMYQLYRREPRKIEAIDLSIMVHDLAKLFSKRLAHKGVSLMLDVQPSMARLYVPQGDLFQVLLNLLQNAVDSSREGRQIALKAYQESDRVRIAVTDHGSGIASEVLPRIFDPFFTTKNDGEHKGMGLGLSVSLTLVQAMGGTIEVQTDLNRGTTFSVLLPLHIASASSALEQLDPGKQLIHDR